MTTHRLDPFFNARSVAIVGASERGLYPAGIVTDLLAYGYAGAIYPVNPGRETVFGLPCFPDLLHVPATPDLAIVIVPRQAVAGVIRQCIGLGISAALIITAGFAEADAEGKVLQNELAELAADGAIALIGPNCAGLADIPSGLIATRLPAPPRPGHVSFISASGALMMALYGVFNDHAVGLRRLLSLGNQVDVGLSEGLAYLVADPETHVIGAFVEGVDDGPGFVAAAHAATVAGKPIVLVKSGQTAAGQQAAATHTAALAGSSRVIRAVCRQHNLVLVDDVDDLVRTVQMFSAWTGRLPRGGRVALVTQSGGMGSLTADLCTQAGLDLPVFAAQLQSKLRQMPHLLSFDDFGNPADVRGAGAEGEATARTLAPFLADGGNDVVVLLLAKSAVREQDVLTAQAIIAAAHSSAKPLCVVWSGQQVPVAPLSWPLAHRLLIEAGIPTFDQPSDCVNALASVVTYGRRRAKLADPAPTPPISPNAPSDAAPRFLSYAEVTDLMARYDIPLAEAATVPDAAAAVLAAERLGYPVAIKALSATLVHKSDRGLVRLNLGDTEAVKSAAHALLGLVPAADLDGLLVQKMVSGGVEVMVGVHVDPQFGPLVAFGLGGVWVELFDEVALRLPNLDAAQALAMIEETRAARLLAGYRGQPPADVTALADLLVNLSRLAVESVGKLVSLDLNPIMVLPQGRGVAVVDARVAWRDA